ncbi:MAG: hypothetical protein WBP26_01380 [Candidatus Saccharimonadales bacterium]
MLTTLLSIVTAFLLMIVLGFVIAFSPSLFFMELAILTRAKHAFRQTIVFLCGIATPIVVLVTLGIFFFDPSKSYDLSLPSLSTILSATPILTICVGLASIFCGIHMLKRSTADIGAAHKQNPTQLRSGMLYWFGCLRMSLSISSLAALLLGIRIIKTMLPGASMQTLGFLWLIAMAMLPFVAIMALYFLWPAKFRLIQNASDYAARFDYRRVLSYILIIIGLLLVLVALLTHA